MSDYWRKQKSRVLISFDIYHNEKLYMQQPTSCLKLFDNLFVACLSIAYDMFMIC